jgi:hypothetical protein
MAADERGGQQHANRDKQEVEANSEDFVRGFVQKGGQ